jgi:hypothetical protein
MRLEKGFVNGKTNSDTKRKLPIKLPIFNMQTIVLLKAA